MTEHSVQRCRDEGWEVGTRLTGERFGDPTVIRITAIGEQQVLAIVESVNGLLYKNVAETRWDFTDVDWKVVDPKPRPEPRYEVTVSVPAHLPRALRENLFDHVTEALNAWEPEDREGWDPLMVAGIVG